MPLYLYYPQWIKPQIIPGLPFHWYGLMYLVAFLITYQLFRYQVSKNNLEFSQDDSMTMFIWILIAALLMARIFATTIYDSTGKYLRKPWLIFWPFDEQMNFTGFQGMSYFGGLVGAVLGAVLWARRYRQKLLKLGDFIVHGFPLAYTFGRIGNFINGELYGRITASPLGIVFPHARRVSVHDPLAADIIEKLQFPVVQGQSAVNLPRHPSQLYEALGEGIILWLILWFIVRPRRKFDGLSVGIYIIGYGLARFFIEFFRELDAGFEFYTVFKLSLGQIFCLLAMLGGGLAIYIFSRIHRNRPKIETFSGSQDSD